MKPPRMFCLLLFAAVLIFVPAVYGQAEATRDKTKDRLSALLTRVGPDISVAFKPSPKTQYIFVGMLSEGLTNAQALEIIIEVTEDQTIRFRIFPKYKAANVEKVDYVNIDKVRNTAQLLRKLVQLNEGSFLFWGADEAGDIFTGYTFTLESGFPDEAIKIVLSNIKIADKVLGQLRPSIDGTNAP